MRCICLSFFLVALGACSSSRESVSEGASEVTRQESPPAITVDATKGRELALAKELFEREQLGDVKELIDAWRPLIRLEGTLRFALVDSSRRDHAVIGEIYGATHSEDARALSERLDTIAPDDDAALARFLEDTRCRFPGLGKAAALHYPSLVMHAPRAEAFAWIREALRKVTDETVPANEVARVFGFSGATTYATEGSRCAMIVFGRAIENAVFTIDPRDTVLHEVGHVLELTSRPVDPAIDAFPPRALGEALADVMSHAHTGSACHVPVPERPGGCLRHLDAKAAEGEDPYAQGQPARFAAWNLIAGRPIAESGPAILAARDGVLNTNRTFAANVVFGRKPTPAERTEFAKIEADTLVEFIAALPH